MELSQLEQFIAIAKNQTMTKAAQQLNISQIALKMLSYCNYFIRAYSKDTESEN